jgi:hypothetical protein
MRSLRQEIQRALFYGFSLDAHVPANHLLRGHVATRSEANIGVRDRVVCVSGILDSASAGCEPLLFRRRPLAAKLIGKLAEGRGEERKWRVPKNQPSAGSR